MQRPIYLDYNATTPVHEEVFREMVPFLKEHFGNPSSRNYYGMIAKKAMDQARALVADLIQCNPEEIIFTSGGTEANNMAVKGLAFAQKHKGKHIITTAIEHPAVVEVCRDLEKYGFEITMLPVNPVGIVDTQEVKNALRPDTILISVMHANNETGAIQPVEEISEIVRQHNIIVHTDAAQSCGKIPVDVRSLGVGLLSLAGHKLYAPKGIGALYVKKGIVPGNIVFGAGQESGKRPGTENVTGIIGLGKACEIAMRDFDRNSEHSRLLRDHLFQELTTHLGENIRLNGDHAKNLPNTLNLSFKGVVASTLVAAAGESVVFSAGAACHSGEMMVSAVIRAMKIPEIWAEGAVRLSVGRFNTVQEIVSAGRIIAEVYQALTSENQA